MYVLIDNSSPDQLAFFCRLDNKIVQRVFRSSAKISLLEHLNCLLKKFKLNLADLRGLAVVAGKGSFTSTRIAVTVANTLAYALRVPVAAVNDAAGDWVEKIRRQKAGRYISARYSGEANIGRKTLKH